MRKLLGKLQSDESLMLAYQRGDVVAFDLLYERHRHALFNFIYRSVQTDAAAEEVAQEVWFALVDGAVRYQANAKFRTFLFQLAHNKTIDYWRRNSRHDDADSFDEKLHTSGKGGDKGEHLVALGQLEQQLDQLPANQRSAILLRAEGFSLAQIAEISGSPPETVKSRLRYGTAQLRQSLEYAP